MQITQARPVPRRPIFSAAAAALPPIATLVLITAQCSKPEDNKSTERRSAVDQDIWQQIPERTEPIRIGLSGAMLGRLEPCGCASGQLGGLPRRRFHVQREDYDILIEGGNLVAGGSELDFQKFYTTLEILFSTEPKYHVLGVGPKDLELDFNEYTGLLSAFDIPLVASDLRPRQEDSTWPAKPFIEREVRGSRVRIASLVSTLPEPLADRLERLRAAAAWSRALEGADDATLRVLLVHDEPDVARRLAGELRPAPDLVVGVGGEQTEPPAKPERVGRVPVVFPGIRGRMVLDLALLRVDGEPRIGYHPIALEGSKTAPGAMQDKAARSSILQHRHQVKDDAVLQKMAEQRPTGNGAAYVGTGKCGECHEQALTAWQNSRHSHAWETLVAAENDPERYGWPVTAYPDCVACHVVGYGERTGFVDMERTPHLADVGCERCHGAGSAHVGDPEAVKMGKVGDGLPATVCTECHDFEQSPEFEYNLRWPPIQHGLK